MLTFMVVEATRTENGVKRTGWAVERRERGQKYAVMTVLIENENDAWAEAERIAKAEHGILGSRPRHLNARNGGAFI